MSNKGKFIVLEGIDGSGKTSQLETISKTLRELFPRGDLLITREPTSKLRELQDPDIWSTMSKSQQVDIFIKDRLYHLQDIVLPMLSKGVNVICDRYFFSTMAYQSSDDADMFDIEKRHTTQSNFKFPDLCLVFDCDVDVAQKRIHNRSTCDIVDSNAEFQKQLSIKYFKLSQMKQFLPFTRIVDSTKDIDRVSELVSFHVRKCFSRIPSLSLILAISEENNVIGSNNQIPWKLRTDMLRFKKLTTDHTIVLGRKTFESFGSKPLPNRHHIILSSKFQESFKSQTWVSNIMQLLSALSDLPVDSEVFIIGGTNLYEFFYTLCQTIYVTVVHTTGIKGDTFFRYSPWLETQTWMILETEFIHQDPQNDFPSTFYKLRRNDLR